MTLAGGSLIFLAAVILFLVGVIFALFTSKGSGIYHHPYRQVYGGAPGATLPCEDFSGADRTTVIEREVVARWKRAPANAEARRAAAAERCRRERSRRLATEARRMPIQSPV